MSDRLNYSQGNWHSDYDFAVAAMPTSTLNQLPGQHHYYPAGQDMLWDDQRGDWFPANLVSLENGNVIYNSYAGVDIVATIVLPNDEPVNLGELQTLSYSMHRENMPVRTLGHTNPIGFVKGPRTISGSMIFTVFNNYAFYRLKQFQTAISHRLYPTSDMLPPFDMVITFANEFGVFSKMKLLGLSIVDEGGTMSIDDLIQEQTFTYMARGIQPLTGFYMPELAEDTDLIAARRIQ